MSIWERSRDGITNLLVRVAAEQGPDLVLGTLILTAAVDLSLWPKSEKGILCRNMGIHKHIQIRDSLRRLDAPQILWTEGLMLARQSR